jgi:hypothetical protein
MNKSGEKTLVRTHRDEILLDDRAGCGLRATQLAAAFPCEVGVQVAFATDAVLQFARSGSFDPLRNRLVRLVLLGHDGTHNGEEEHCKHESWQRLKSLRHSLARGPSEREDANSEIRRERK